MLKCEMRRAQRLRPAPAIPLRLRLRLKQSSCTIDTFKNRLDKFWRNQDVLFDYKANLTGIGNRSEKNEDFI